LPYCGVIVALSAHVGHCAVARVDVSEILNSACLS